MRLVKGSHIIVPKFWKGENAYLVQNHDKRVIFINPYERDKALIGTTDIAYEGRAEDVEADEGEIQYLIDAVNRYFKEQLTKLGEKVDEANERQAGELGQPEGEN